MSALRIAAAALAVALATSLWPASVHIVSWPETGPERVAVFAPLARMVVVLSIAAAAAAALWWWAPRTAESRRRRAHVIAPASLLALCVVPYLPWLPDRVPVVLIFAGPMRCVIAVVACVLAVLRGTRRDGQGARHDWPLRPAYVFAIAFAVYSAIGLHSLQSLGLKGDEPHYLMISQSLLSDGDLRIENNHRLAQYRSFTRETLPPDYLQRGKDGEIYSIHAPGLPTLLLPAYAIGGARASVIAIALLAACAIVAVYHIGAAVDGPAVGATTAAIVGLTVPFVPYAWAIFPEMAGAAAVA
jgi:hypothetical protein